MSKRRGSLFQHLGLRARIMSLAAVPLIGLLAVAVMGQIAERRQATVEAAYESKRVAVEALSGFASDLAKMRITSEAYRQRPDAEGLEAFNASASAAAAMLKELEAKGGTATAADIRPFLTAYVDDFRALVKQLKENGLTTSDGMLGAVAFAGLKAKGELSIREGELGAWAGTLRDVLSEIMIAERDFRATQMNSHATHFERLHDNLNKILNVSQLGSESRKELVSAFSEYKAKFGDWVDGVQHVMTLANRHAADYTGISNRVSAARTAAISSMVEARNAAAEVASSRENWTLGLFGVVIALSLVIASTIGISAARELAGLSASMRRLAEGDAEVQIPAINRKDEVGTMAAALTALRDGVRERLALVSRNESVSSERLARAQDVERAIRSFEIEVGEALAGLHDASEAMRQVSHELDAAAVEAEAQAISAGGDTSRAANEIETASVAAQQLSSSVDEVAGQAVKSDQAAGEALREVERAALAMGELTSQADRIGEIVGVISSIASQTNLLALNATIEAARAGEAGRGFAVVAAEVKELANQTGSATGEIAGQIEGIRSAAKGVIAAVTSLNGTISEVSRIAGSVAAAVEEQSTALSGISGNIVAASEGAMRGAEGIRTVEVAISDTSRNASRMRDVSEKLSADAARLNNKVGWFLNEVRAA